MFKVFLKGLVFGLGLAVGLGVSVAAYQLLSGLTPDQTQFSQVQVPAPVATTVADQDFFGLPVEERISRSSVILVARFEEASGGKRRAVITEILKKQEGVAFPFSVGDEYHRASIYSEDGVDYGTGVIVFLTGQDASFRESVSFRGDRVFGLGNMPITMFREKCKVGA